MQHDLLVTLGLLPALLGNSSLDLPKTRIIQNRSKKILLLLSCRVRSHLLVSYEAPWNTMDHASSATYDIYVYTAPRCTFGSAHAPFEPGASKARGLCALAGDHGMPNRRQEQVSFVRRAQSIRRTKTRSFSLADARGQQEKRWAFNCFHEESEEVTQLMKHALFICNARCNLTTYTQQYQTNFHEIKRRFEAFVALHDK